MRTTTSLTAVLCTLMLLAPSVHAQSDHAVNSATLDAAIQQHLTASSEERDTVLRVLQRPEVTEQAARLGIDLRKATSAVSTLDGAELQALAAQSAQVEEALAGGQSRVVISTTLIIIALLVLILLIVAID